MVVAYALLAVASGVSLLLQTGRKQNAFPVHDVSLDLLTMALAGGVFGWAIWKKEARLAQASAVVFLFFLFSSVQGTVSINSWNFFDWRFGYTYSYGVGAGAGMGIALSLMGGISGAERPEDLNGISQTAGATFGLRGTGV